MKIAIGIFVVLAALFSVGMIIAVIVDWVREVRRNKATAELKTKEDKTETNGNAREESTKEPVKETEKSTAKTTEKEA